RELRADRGRVARLLLPDRAGAGGGHARRQRRDPAGHRLDLWHRGERDRHRGLRRLRPADRRHRRLRLRRDAHRVLGGHAPVAPARRAGGWYAGARRGRTAMRRAGGLLLVATLAGCATTPPTVGSLAGEWHGRVSTPRGHPTARLA